MYTPCKYLLSIKDLSLAKYQKNVFFFTYFIFIKWPFLYGFQQHLGRPADGG